jgi:hypothetical protein
MTPFRQAAVDLPKAVIPAKAGIQAAMLDEE